MLPTSSFDPLSQTYRSPDVKGIDVTPLFVRDELLTCFESANREFARILNQPVTDDALKQQVRTFVESVFSQCGVSYNNPTKEGIMTAISECKSNAEKMMGPQAAGIIQHHFEEMMRLVNKLEG